MATVSVRRKKPAARPGPGQPPPELMPLYRLSVKEYLGMIAAGLLELGDQSELLEGWIVFNMVHNPPHDSTLTELARKLYKTLPDDVIVRVQCAITTRDSVPEPDIAVVRRAPDQYRAEHPVPQDVFLVIEVSDATLARDQGTKLRLYARARLPLYWIVNLVDRRVEVYTSPRGGRAPTYRSRQDYGPGEAVPLVIAGREYGTIAVDDLLP